MKRIKNCLDPKSNSSHILASKRNRRSENLYLKISIWNDSELFKTKIQASNSFATEQHQMRTSMRPQHVKAIVKNKRKLRNLRSERVKRQQNYKILSTITRFYKLSKHPLLKLSTRNSLLSQSSPAFPVAVRCDHHPVLFGDLERRLRSLVDDVADADSRKHFEEVWSDAPVQPGNAFLLKDFPPESDESLLCIFWRWKQTEDTFVIWQRHSGTRPIISSRVKKGQE